MTDTFEQIVEKAAQAIFDADNGLDGDKLSTVLGQSEIADQGDLEKHLEIVRHLCRIAARTALISAGLGPRKVIVPREPTEAMRSKGGAVIERFPTDNPSTWDDAADVYRAMIAAAEKD